jgi:tetratricopeptide (TPR) repeat protein
LQAAINELDPGTQGNELALATASIGRFHHYRGQHRQALIHLEQARQIAEPLDDPRTLFSICFYLAGAYQQLAELEKSVEWAQCSITLGEQKNYPPSVVVGYEYLTEVSILMGKWQEAIEYARQEIEIGTMIGHLDAVNWAELNLAYAYHGLGDLSTAEGPAQKSLTRAKAMGNSRLAVYALARLSIIQTDLGLLEQAEGNARKAVDQVSDLDQTMMARRSLHALAYWHMQQGDWEKAFEHLDRAARIISKTDNRYYPLINGPLYAEASLQVGQLDKAAEIVKRTLALARTAPSPHIEAVTRRVQAQILAARALWDKAAPAFDDAITQLDRLGSRLELGRALYHQGKMQIDLENATAARASLTRALDIFQDCSAETDAQRTRAALDSLETDE